MITSAYCCKNRAGYRVIVTAATTQGISAFVVNARELRHGIIFLCDE